MSQQQGQEQGTNSMDLLWGVAFVVAIVLVLWYFARGPIIQFLFLVKLGEIYLVSFFTDALEPVRQEILRFYDVPKEVTIPQLQLWFNAVGKYLRIPTMAIVALLGIYIFLKHPTLKFKNIFSMDRLRQLEKENWPQITPVCELDLVHTPINEGPWAMAESPMEFAKSRKLLEELPRPIDPLLARLNLTEVKVLEHKARAEFIRQMGPPFEDLNKMPIHAKALFAIFAARAGDDAKGAEELTLRIAASSEGGKLDFTGAMPLLRKHYNTKAIAQILGQHAYLYGVLASMLELARTTGVLASADFLWLKPLDRKMWYMLNSTGRRTPFAEIAGPYSHWLAEKALRRKITQPMIDGAVKGLEEAVKLIIYTRDE